MPSHMTTCTRELLSDICSPKLVPGLIQGLLLGAFLVILEVSFANIIFSGPLASHATRAAGMCIFGAGAICLVTGLFSPFSSMASLPQDAPVVILSIAATAIVAAIPAASSEVLFATVAGTLIGSALITALFFWFIGKFGLANFARFLPFPVIGGFLAGSGVMLLLGSFGVMTGESLLWSTLPQYMTMDMFIHWGPGVFFALGVFILMRRWSHFLILPGAMLVGLIAFFLIIVAFGLSIPEIRSQGWLPTAMPTGQIWPGFTVETVGMIDWPVLLTQLPNMLTIALLSLISVILNVNGIELGVHQDINLDQELKVESFGNILAGLGGGFAGYAALSLSMLGPRSNTISRIIPVTGALVCIGVLFVGAQIITFIPKPLLGGLLFLLGLFFVDEWIFSGRKRFTPVDYIIVLVIVLTIVSQGFLPGVGIGIGLTCVIFMVQFARIPVIQDEETLTTLHSSRQRSIPDQILLSREGQNCIILKLSGYLFFGSTYFVGKRVKELFDEKGTLEHLILDLTKIQGFDISAINTFQRIGQQALAKEVTLSIASAPNRLLELIKRNSSPEVMQQFTASADLDCALESREDQLLAKHQQRIILDSIDAQKAREDLFHAAVDNLDSHLQEQEHFEDILENMSSYLTQTTVMAEDVLVAEGSLQEDVIFVLWGSISLFVTDEEGEQRRLTAIGPGEIIAPKAAWGSWAATYTARVEQQAMVAAISSKAVRKMEADAPETAMILYKYMAEILDKGYS